jgi:hypothetical protein
MKIREGVLAVVVAAIVASQGFAAETAAPAAAGHDGKIANIRKLVHIMSGRQMKDAMAKTLESSRRAIESQMPADVDPEEKRAFDDYMKSLEPTEKDLEEMLDLMIPYYDKYLDDADVAALVRFYESPAGRKYIRVLPEMMAEMMPRLMDRQMETMRNAMEAYRKRLEEIKKKGTGTPAVGPNGG